MANKKPKKDEILQKPEQKGFFFTEDYFEASKKFDNHEEYAYFLKLILAFAFGENIDEIIDNKAFSDSFEAAVLLVCRNILYRQNYREFIKNRANWRKKIKEAVSGRFKYADSLDKIMALYSGYFNFYTAAEMLGMTESIAARCAQNNYGQPKNTDEKRDNGLNTALNYFLAALENEFKSHLKNAEIPHDNAENIDFPMPPQSLSAFENISPESLENTTTEPIIGLNENGEETMTWK